MVLADLLSSITSGVSDTSPSGTSVLPFIRFYRLEIGKELILVKYFESPPSNVNIAFTKVLNIVIVDVLVSRFPLKSGRVEVQVTEESHVFIWS
jgi:hypothetical protein